MIPEERQSFPIPTWPPDWPEIRYSVQQCLSSGDWGNYQSEMRERLKSRLSEDHGGADIQLCCSGTAAIELALRACGVGKGDEVVVAAMDYPGNFRCIELVGARPVLVDIQSSSPTIDADSLRKISRPNIKAVIASHLFGHTAELKSISDLCLDRGWKLIEDACQTIGTYCDGQHVGTFSDVATLSFGGSKIVSAGSGGALITKRSAISARLRSIDERPSQAFPLSPLQAAAVLPQLDRLNELNRIRTLNAAAIATKLGNAKNPRSMTALCASTDQGQRPAYYKLALQSATKWQRDAVLLKANERHIPMGECFRSMHRSSDRRCEKPVPLENAANFSERVCLLDQRVLLTSQEDQPLMLSAVADLID